MERHRDIRRGNMAAAAAANGLSRRRPRSSASTSNSLRDSPEDDGAVELQETTRLRDRASKKERERLNRNKRRRGDRLMLGGHREDGGEDSTEDSIDDDEEDEDDESSHLRMRPPNHVSSSSAQSNHHLHRKSFPPAAKVVRATTWRVSDEMGFSVPKKARSASTKRAHESLVSGVCGGVGGGSGEQVHRQASTSPARPSAAPTPAPASPSSSTASVRKKMKPIGAKPKQRPPKPSPVQDDIEIEVAEVLYGLMRQSQCPSRQESTANSSQKHDSRDVNGSGNDAKSRVSSPISASPLLSKVPQNSSSTTTPVSAVAPKRKKPRPVKFEEENSANFANRNESMTSSKIEGEQLTKTEASSTKLDKNSGSDESRNGVSLDFGSSQATNVPMDTQQEFKTESNLISESKPAAEESAVRVDVQIDNIVTSPKKESSCSKTDFDPENATATKVTPTSVVESHREESFKIDLMAPPLKSSPERDGDIGFVSESKPVASDAEMKLEADELKENVDINCKMDIEEAVVHFEKKTDEATVDECVSQKPIVQKHTMLDLQIDSAKDNKECGPSSVRQQQLLLQPHQQSKTIRNEPKLEIPAESVSSMPLPMGITGWPGSLPPMGNGMGQIRPTQGVTSLDGTPGSSNAIQPPPHLLTQPRPKRCSTHYYIARNIYYHQQFTKMSPFWPTAAGSASLYGNKPYNLNVMPPTETAGVGNPLSRNFAGKNLSSLQDRGQAEGAKDKSSVAANFLDSSQGKVVPKQMVLQQSPQQPSIQGPALIFPMNQQQAAVVSGSKNGAAKASNTGNAPSIAAQSAAGAMGNLSASAAGPTTMSFNYPNMAGNEAHYVAILQNNGYQFPVPAHVGAPSSYKATAPPAMPFYNGPFYPSQMMQLQQQQMQQSHSQQQPSQQGHQNTSTSSGSSSSQKHQQHNHHQRLQGSGSNAASGTSNSFPASKNRQQKQQNQSFPVAHQVRHHDTDIAVEDGPSADDNRISLAHKNTYNHNFAMPMHGKNFASLSSAAMASGTGNHSERQQQQQHQNLKGGPESTPNQTFAMPFTSFNGVSGLDFSSMAQNHVIFQNLPDAARHGYQIAAAAAQTAQQKKNHHILEEGKAISDSNNTEDERKAPVGKGQSSGSQAIMFSRTDSADPSVSTILSNSVVESSARTLNLISSPGNGNRNSRTNSSTTAAPATTTVNTSYSQQQQQQQHQQQKQMGQLIHMQQLQQMQLMRQQQMHQQIAAAAAARGKPSTTNSTSVYTDGLSSSSSMTAKFPNTHYYPEALVQGGSSTQSPQWKNTRTAAPSSSSPCLASATSSLKNLPQQQGRAQQGHTQISFGVNSKPGSAQHGQQISTGNQSPSSPVVVGSPPTSISKSAGGSPRASSTGNKMAPAPSLSSQQQGKTSSSGPSRKSSPVGGRNAPSNLGNSHINPAPCSTSKSSQSQHQQALHQQQQQQQQQQKQALHQAQLFFSNAYMQAQSPQSNSTSGNTSGAPINVYYQQRRQVPEQQQASNNTTSSGMLSLCPLTLAATTSDPAKAVAANMKGGLPPPGIIQAAQFATQSGGHPYMSTTFPYIHSVPSVQVKSAEQKQPAGNDNLHA